MAHAPRAEQLVLLDVSEFDSHIARLERDNVKHPLRQKIGTLMNVSVERAREKDAAEAALAEARSALEKAEKQSATLQAQIEDKDGKLNAGVGLTSRDLLVLQEEIAGLRALLSEASDAEFEALEAVEKAETRVSDLAGQIDEMKQQVLADRTELEDAVTEIQAQQAALRAQRDAIFTPLGEDIKKVYEHSRASGGYAVIGMRANGTTDAGVQLSPVEVAQIKALPEDAIYLSEDYDAIVVRLD